MKSEYLFFLPLLWILGCNDTGKMQNQIDDLTVQLANSYKPGFGEFMSGIQVHHAKLWFAGTKKNWKLADFELHEIGEAVEAIQQFQKERKESQVLPMLVPAMDSVRMAIQLQESKLFVRSFTTLTNTCNACHQAVKFEFTVVKIPDTPPFSNQDFSVRQE